MKSMVSTKNNLLMAIGERRGIPPHESEMVSLSRNLLKKIYVLRFCRRVSIVRGRVVTMTGQGIIGVRVSVDRTQEATNYGFTLTRPDGW